MKALKYQKYIVLVLFALFLISCSRNDENDDVLSQEDISNIILNVKNDATGITSTYNYTVNSVSNPVIKLSDGQTYTVTIDFLNGNSNETASIKAAKDEHFLIFNFQGSLIELSRFDDASSTRTDGMKVGLITKWKVIKAANSANPQLVLTLIHGATSVNESQNGTVFGKVTGGETDAMANYTISN